MMADHVESTPPDSKQIGASQISTNKESEEKHSKIEFAVLNQMTYNNNNTTLLTVNSLVKDIIDNHTCLQEEWGELRRELESTQPVLDPVIDNVVPIQQTAGFIPNEDCVWVRRSDLQKLCAEVMQLKEIMPKLLRGDLMSAYTKVADLEEKLSVLAGLQAKTEKLQTRLLTLEAENQQLQARLETSVSQCQREKQENKSLHEDVKVLSSQLSQQSEYCTSLGTACGTLLWRVSRNEDCVQTMLSGSTVNDFLSLVSSTLESYLSAYKVEWPDDQSPESQFVLALCGTVTNIAASAYGREFLVTNSNGLHLIDVYLETVAEAPGKKAGRLKCLLLMALYNLTINKKGLKELSTKSGLVQLLMFILKDEVEGESRLHSLHLIQSLICDETSAKALNEFLEMTPVALLQGLAKDKNKNIRQTAAELLVDLKCIGSEQ